MGYRVRRRHYERLRVPGYHSVEPSAVSDRLLRTALQRESEPAALCRFVVRKHFIRQPRGCGSRYLRRRSADLRPRSRSTSVSGATCIRVESASTTSRAAAASARSGAEVLPNGNVMKKDVSFYEVYGKATYTFNDYFALGANVYYSPNFLNTGADGTYASVTAKATAPTGWFGSSGVGRLQSRANSVASGWVLPMPSMASRCSRTASTTPTTTPGTSASVSPTRCSRWICATPTPIWARATATLSPATSLQPVRPSPRSTRVRAPTGAARPSSRSCRLTSPRWAA